MGTPASGAAMVLGLRPEATYNIPDLSASFVYQKPDPPVSMALTRTLSQSPQINQSGFQELGIPGPITGPLDDAIALQASTILEFIENLMGGHGVLAKTTLESGVYQYVGTAKRTLDTSYSGLRVLSPVDQYRLYGLKFSSLTIPVGNNNMSVARIAGFISHGTHLSAPVHASGSGTYVKGPEVRGLMRKPRVGEKLYLKATRTVAGGGLQYKAERVPSGGTATYPGAAIDAVYDADLNGTWDPLAVAYQLTGTVSVTISTTAVTGVGTDFLNELVVGDYLTIAGENIKISAIASATALTLASAHSAGASGVVAHKLLAEAGYWTENRDPLEVIFIGTATDHGDIVAVSTPDVWTFAVAFTAPAATYTSGQRFTAAHWFLDYRRQGSTVWLPLAPLTGTFVLSNPLTVGQGWGSRYYSSLDREGMFVPTLQITRKFTDTALQQAAESHEPLELRVRQLGQRLGTGLYRESIAFVALAAQIITYAAPVAGPAAVIETISFAFDASAAGDPPITPTVITDRNYTVAA